MITDLVNFSVTITKEGSILIDYHANRNEYCHNYRDSQIARMFREVINSQNGVTLFYTKLQIVLLENEILKNPAPFKERELQELQDRFAERYAEYYGSKEGTHGNVRLYDRAYRTSSIIKSRKLIERT